MITFESTGKVKKLMITVHHLENSRSQRILWLLEELGIDYEIKPVSKRIAEKARAAYSGPNIKLNLGYLEGVLQNSSWFCGAQMSGADIMMSFPIETAAARTDLTANYPALAGFRQRIKQLPACQRAIEKGGPYIY